MGNGRLGGLKRLSGFFSLVLFSFLAPGVVAVGASAQVTTLVSVGIGGDPANGASVDPSISADGRYVAFVSDAYNIVHGDTNGVGDVFVRDLQTGTSSRVSLSAGGGQANSRSYNPSISANGRYVAFVSDASNLVPGDTNGAGDVFVHDRQTGTTSRVSVRTGGGQANLWSDNPSISADGRYVAFASPAWTIEQGDTNGFMDVFVHDQQVGTTARASIAWGELNQTNGNSDYPSISADGRYVAFVSHASNLAQRGDTNPERDVFVFDRHTGSTSLVSVTSSGVQANTGHPSRFPSISADGRYVAFISHGLPGFIGIDQIFLHDRQTATTSRMDVATGGSQANRPSKPVSGISGDGRYVAYASDAFNLVLGDNNAKTDVFIHDRQTGETFRVSIATGGAQTNGDSDSPSVSTDGRYVAFRSDATNLDPRDTNRLSDIFVADRYLMPVPKLPPTPFSPLPQGGGIRDPRLPRK